MFPPGTIPLDIINPLTPALFTDFVLVPHVAMSLIAEDIGNTEEAGWHKMVESGDYGEAIFQDDEDDKELQQILDENVRACRSEKMAKEKEVMSSTSRITFYLTDFAGA